MIHFDERGMTWVYSATATAALVLALAVPTHHVVPARARGAYLRLQMLTLLGAIVGAKVAFLAGDLGWPVHRVSWAEVLLSGRSITGGLLGGFLFAEAGKVALRYDELPNDRFAAKLPLSIAVGRIGCVVAGCCPGLPTESAWAVVYSDGVPRFPAQLVELAFQLVAFGVLVALVRSGRFVGRIFAIYMMAYGGFRLVVETWRATPKLASGLSVYQIFALGLALAGAGSFAWYARAARKPMRQSS